MCRIRFTILSVLLFFLAQDTVAQKSLNFFFRHVNQWDGLLNNQVLSISQDGKGFIWIASVGGLQRYDGSRFKYYPEMLSDPAEGITIGAEMHADQKKNLLWITNGTSIEKMELGK